MSGGSKPPADLAWREAWGTHNQPMSDENQIVVPASFGDLFYGLRGHIDMVRANLLRSSE